jgi:hypothetical protein
MSMTYLENSRKYFSHSLVIIDDHKEKRVANNVARSLWGLVKVCKAINSVSKKEDPKNTELLEVAKERL